MRHGIKQMNYVSWFANYIRNLAPEAEANREWKVQRRDINVHHG
jgi:hypothetical protein